VRNIRLLIAFDGTRFNGWQRQKNTPTIQGEIEKRLSVMTREIVCLHGAGRTDAGVHALGMVANFRTAAGISCRGFLNGLNSMLDPAIRIRAVDEVDERFDSRRGATGKIYRYTIFTGGIQAPLERLYAAHCPMQPNADAIGRALEHIKGTHDFSSFEGSGSRDLGRSTGRGAVRTVYHAGFTPEPGKPETWIFRFIGDGFLRHMVRNLVGTLLLVGRGKMSSEAFRAILQGHDRRLAGPTAPAHGLVLEQVLYKPIPPPNNRP
jgi:tRNA pseudouridine38-40 synthase